MISKGLSVIKNCPPLKEIRGNIVIDAGLRLMIQNIL